MRTARTSAPGFTLVELILVMSILTLLGLLAVYAIANVVDHTKTVKTQSTMRLIDIALDAFRTDKGSFPTGTGTDLVTALTVPGTTGWKRASLQTWFPKHVAILDAWDNPFYYCSSEQYDYDNPVGTARGVERTPSKKDFYNPKTFQLYSCGPNLQTWPNTTAQGGHPRLAGTEPDDIRNWTQERFYKTNTEAYP